MINAAKVVLLIVDAGPINSLWVAGRLDLIEKLGLPVVIIDEVFAELTGDPDHYQKDRDVKNFIETAEFISIEQTYVGQMVASDRLAGKKVKSNMGEVAITEFLTDEDTGSGLNKYVQKGDSTLLLFEDSGIPDMKIIRQTSNVHLISTVALLRGMEELHIIESADDIIKKMTHPEDTQKARKLKDLPDGIDIPARTGSTWRP